MFVCRLYSFIFYVCSCPDKKINKSALSLTLWKDKSCQRNLVLQCNEEEMWRHFNQQKLIRLSGMELIFVFKFLRTFLILNARVKRAEKWTTILTVGFHFIFLQFKSKSAILRPCIINQVITFLFKIWTVKQMPALNISFWGHFVKEKKNNKFIQDDSNSSKLFK